jgi:hypothetical protein
VCAIAHGITSTEQYGPRKTDHNYFLSPGKRVIHHISEEDLQDEGYEHDYKRSDGNDNLKNVPGCKQELFHT